MSDACVDAVTRTRFCRHCSGAEFIKPCQNLCLNTMRGCFAGFAEVNSDWNAFIGKFRLPYICAGRHFPSIRNVDTTARTSHADREIMFVWRRASRAQYANPHQPQL